MQIYFFEFLSLFITIIITFYIFIFILFTIISLYLIFYILIHKRFWLLKLFFCKNNWKHNQYGFLNIIVIILIIFIIIIIIIFMITVMDQYWVKLSWKSSLASSSFISSLLSWFPWKYHVFTLPCIFKLINL
jgi:hypothetical protein